MLMRYVALALLLGNLAMFGLWQSERADSAECETGKAVDAVDAASATTDAVKDAAAENQAATEAVHEAGDSASVQAAEEISKLRAERDAALRKLQEAYRHDATADHWRHERIPDSVRRVLTASRDQAGGGPG